MGTRLGWGTELGASGGRPCQLRERFQSSVRTGCFGGNEERVGMWDIMALFENRMSV